MTLKKYLCICLLILSTSTTSFAKLSAAKTCMAYLLATALSLSGATATAAVTKLGPSPNLPKRVTKPHDAIMELNGNIGKLMADSKRYARMIRADLEIKDFNRIQAEILDLTGKLGEEFSLNDVLALSMINYNTSRAQMLQLPGMSKAYSSDDLFKDMLITAVVQMRISRNPVPQTQDIIEFAQNCSAPETVDTIIDFYILKVGHLLSTTEFLRIFDSKFCTQELKDKMLFTYVLKFNRKIKGTALEFDWNDLARRQEKN